MATQVVNASSGNDGWPGGQVTLQVLFDSWVNSGIAVPASDVTIGITASGTPQGGEGTPVETTASGIIPAGTGTFQYVWNIAEDQAPGDYMVSWTGTRESDSAQVIYAQNVTVAANPVSSPAPGVYASVTDYQLRTLDMLTPSTLVAMRLQLASEQIDAQITMAVYATDANGMPLNPLLADILQRACIEQCRYLCARNDDANLKDEYQSMNMGGISYSRGACMAGSRMMRLCPQAKSILHAGGVLQGAPLVNW